MPYARKTFTGERARQVARSGRISKQGVRRNPWWPEEICMELEKIIWFAYCLGETENWHEFTAYDKCGNILGIHRIDGY